MTASGDRAHAGRLLGAVALACLLAPAALLAQRITPLEGRIWLDKGAEPTLQRGETARLYYRASADAYVAIFQIDTNGSARLIFPRTPDESNLVRGELDYRLLFASSSFWLVEEDPGVGYFFLVASPTPLDFSSFRYSYFDRGWDLSRVARDVYSDPYVAMDDYVAALIPNWQNVPYALDFVSYHVGARFEYPRFLCYSCHGFRPYAAWNPYAFDCSSVRVLIYNDPYYSAASRYRGDRVVYVRPSRPFEPRFDFKERTAGESAAPLLVGAQRRSTAGIGSGGTAVPSRPSGRLGGADASRGGVGPGAPADGIQAPPRGAVSGGGGVPAPSGAGAPGVTEDRGRPVLQQRPPADAGRGTPSGQGAQPPPATTRDGRQQAPPPALRPDPRRNLPPAAQPDDRQSLPPATRQARPDGPSVPSTSTPPPREAQPRPTAPPPSRDPPSRDVRPQPSAPPPPRPRPDTLRTAGASA